MSKGIVLRYRNTSTEIKLHQLHHLVHIIYNTEQNIDKTHLNNQ